MNRAHALALAAAAIFTTTMPSVACAQASNPNAWQFRVALYGYLPDVTGKSSFPTGNLTPNIDVDAGDILKIQGAFMATLEAQYQRFGVWSDYIYVDLGSDKSGTRSFSIGNAGVPAGVSADLHYKLRGSIWTIAGTYRVLADPASTLDVLAGARLADVRETLDWNFSADLGPLQPARTGSSTDKVTNWDAIVGVKGRLGFGPDRQWFVPYYLDVGTGESDFTWQGLAGIGYSVSSWDFALAWRYLDYHFKSGSSIETAKFSGPLIGVAFRW
jgi:hypothetical protein